MLDLYVLSIYFCISGFSWDAILLMACYLLVNTKLGCQSTVSIHVYLDQI